MFLSCALVLAMLQAPLGPLRKPNLETKPQNQRQIPTVTFTWNWPVAAPQFVKIEVEWAGRASYLSQNAPPQSARTKNAQPKLAEPMIAEPQTAEPGTAEPQTASPESSSDAQQQPYTERFTFSQAARQQIFELARAAHYFNGNFEFRGKVSQTGTKTLAYLDETRNYATTYNWSENAAIERLTRIFQATSQTVEAGRRLRALMRYDPLGLDEELGRIEEAAEDGQMSELGILRPALEKIASDSRYMHVAQQRARHLLEIAEREGGSAASASE